MTLDAALADLARRLSAPPLNPMRAEAFIETERELLEIAIECGDRATYLGFAIAENGAGAEFYIGDIDEIFELARRDGDPAQITIMSVGQAVERMGRLAASSGTLN